MLALVNSDNSEALNQHALSVAAGSLAPFGHPYVVFFHHERCANSDRGLDHVVGEPSEYLAVAWMQAEEAALDVLPVVGDDTYLIWMGDN